MGVRLCIVSLLTVAEIAFSMLMLVLTSSVESANEKEPQQRLLLGITAGTAYYFPFFVSICAKIDGRYFLPLGSGTLLTERRVIASHENVARENKIDKYRYKMKSIYAIAGVDSLNSQDASSKFKQIKMIRAVYVAKDSSFLESGQTQSVLISPERTVDYSKGFQRGPFGGLEWEVALLDLDAPIQRSMYVLPMPIIHREADTMFKKVEEMLEVFENHPFGQPPCKVPGWSSVGTNEMIYHKVVYVRKKECQEALCAKFPHFCFIYPDFRFHTCFKSLSFGDACLMDQGAPLYCPTFGKSIFAVLTRTFECGMTALPGIYTLVSHIFKFDDLTPASTRRTEERPDYTKYVLTG